MSIVQLCPYDINGEHCKYEIYYGEPIFSKCKNCSRTIFKRVVEMKDEEMAEEYLKQNNYTGGYIGYFPSAYCKQAFLAGLKAGRPQWHKLREKYPEADKLVRVRLMSGMEHICETCYYESTEDEIGYGKVVINFYELNGEWVDDNDIIAWCEIPTFDKE